MTTIDAKKFYNEQMPVKQGADYEHARWHKNAVASVGYEQTKASIETYLPTLTGMSNILEVGPGAGTWTKLLLTKYSEADLTLLDISREMLNRSKATLGDASITYVESAFGDYQTDAKYDLVFSSRMLEYMEDKEVFVTKLKALLKPGGRAVLITKFPHYGRQQALGKSIRDFHTGQIAPPKLAKLMEAAGLTVTTTRAVTVSVPVCKSARLNKIVGTLVRALPLNPITNTCVESYLMIVKAP